ncbi:Hyaluronan synthase [Algoriella xinjiangensis]|uniref:glycosyltransferase family 2 protein n=1 Tax=Algoriella xinjiangensis TaxID=684065 RepID=UPI000F63EF9C|nr:glycosyltransferase family A protein [Algoriella xinjiangensis]VDH17425.1 Hyaluronan synthase [Algoriella xinjiangensis]
MITVFTPTFNREKTLNRLYQSLLLQTNKNFEWLVVDDGSSDNTELIVNSWIEDGILNISYFKQKNGGKHRAINKGLELAKGELFFIVDSDDYLPNDSLKIIMKYYEDVKLDENIIGVVGLYKNKDGEILGGKKFPHLIIDSDLIERREKYGVTADMAKVLKTSNFKKFLFPDIEGEKFVAESLVWNRMAINHKFRYFNEAIYVAEYMEDGLSSASIRNRRKNPLYATLLYNELAHNPKAPFKLKMKSLINFWRFSFCKSNNLLSLLREIKMWIY